MKENIVGYAYDDETTKSAMREVKAKYDYIIDPHGAVGYLALKDYQKEHDVVGIILETAHPAKFLDDVEGILEQKIDVPERLASLADKKKESRLSPTDFGDFKNWLLANY